MSEPRSPHDHTRPPESSGTFLLSENDIAKLLFKGRLKRFLADLADEIEVIYRDEHLEPITRAGWTWNQDALEIMGCASEDYAAVKIISSNPSAANDVVPTVSGSLYCAKIGTNQVILECDVATLTALRTAAGTYVVLRRIMPEATKVGIVGAGLEGEAHAVALSLMCDNVQKIVFADIDFDKALRTASAAQELFRRQSVSGSREVTFKAIDSQDTDQLYGSDVIVTATYGSVPVVNGLRLRSGTFIAAVGGDLEGKRELDDAVYRSAKFVADDLGQCLRQGELQYAAPQYRLATDYAGYTGRLGEGRIISVGDLLADVPSFSTRAEPITVYDSTGFSGQDLAVARVLLRLLKEVSWARTQWHAPRALSLLERLTPEELRATCSGGMLSARTKLPEALTSLALQARA